MEDQPKAEHVTYWLVFSAHIFDIDDLRSNIAWSTASNEEIIGLIRKFSKAKVRYYTVPASFLPEDQILRLKVTMHDLFGVHFLQTK